VKPLSGKPCSVGIQPGRIVSSDIKTVAEVSRFLGFRAASYYVGDDRETWLVLVHGSYQPQFWAPGQTPPVYNYYYVVVDASTGNLLSSGTPLTKAR